MILNKSTTRTAIVGSLVLLTKLLNARDRMKNEGIRLNCCESITRRKTVIAGIEGLNEDRQT